MVDLDASRTAPPRTAWDTVRTGVLAVLAVEVLVLIVTGVALYFWYRPTASQAWADLVEMQTRHDLPTSVVRSNWLRLAHRLAAYAAFPTGLAAAVVILVGRRAPMRSLFGGVHAVVLVAVPVLAIFTGFLLPWDQLALWAVTVGTNVDGYGILFDDRVRFVIMNNSEVTPGTILMWLGIHVALAGVLVMTVVAAWRRTRRGAG